MHIHLPHILRTEADAYLAAIISSSDDAIIGQDLNGNITFWNPAAVNIFGYTAEEVTGKHISIIIPPEKLSEEKFFLDEIRQGNRIDHFETVRRRKDGKLISISTTVSPIRNKDGNIIGASKIARDITEAQHAYRISAHLSAIIESSDDAIISKDLKGFVTSWNKSAERIFGYTAEEIVGKHITLLIPSERLEEEDKILVTLKTGERIDHFETIRRHKDGSLVPVSITVSPIRDAAGNIIGASKVSRDISDRIRAEEALRESSQKKDDFMANMSHELRTPMNAVIGIANLLHRMDGMPPQAGKFIDTLKTSADHLMNLINDLLDFARIEDDSFQLESARFNLLEQIEKTISVINVKAQEKGIRLYSRYAPNLNHFYIGDPLRIHQILMNLLSNAVKFTSEGSIKVDISGAPAPTDAETILTFKVTDTGIGIRPDNLNKIFDKFVQADSSITRQYGGSGLGLSIVKTCVTKMGGTISVESQLGIGSTFTFTLPLKNTDDTAGAEDSSDKIAPAIPLHRKKHVLLVEDYMPNVMVAGAMLEELGYDYEVAQNGMEALRRFAYGTYDIVLMDIQMKDMDGLEATRRIRRMEAEKGLKRTPIIAMTAHVQEKDKDKCLEAGMNDFIPKPFDPAQLSEKITRYIPSLAGTSEADALPKTPERY